MGSKASYTCQPPFKVWQALKPSPCRMSARQAEICFMALLWLLLDHSLSWYRSLGRALSAMELHVSCFRNCHRLP